MRNRRWLIGVVSGLLIVGLAPLAAQAAATSAVTAQLAPGHAAFWNGTWAASGDVESPSLCGTQAGDCWTYELVTTAPAWRLRVGLDHPVRSDTYQFSIYDSKGTQLASATTSDAFSAEALVSKPAAGTYIIQVLPQGVTDTTFRMRAKLETTPPPPPTAKVPLLPHLRADPPYEFTFTAPANPANGLYPPDTANPPLELAGEAPLSCSADETATYGVQRCLRFTSGPVNEGGPFEIDYNFVADTEAQRPYTAYQVIHWSDGSVTTRPAGTYEFHYIHGHFHYDGILDYELWKVTDIHTGTMSEVGAGFKNGFCPADEVMGQWSRFVQDEAGTYNSGSAASGGNCDSFTNGVLGLSSGWGDVYRWQRPEQFVDFDGQTDGYYVVKAIADVNHNVEGTLDNNVSYAYIYVQGNTIDLLERGFGQSPWDPAKQPVTLGGGPEGWNN